MIHPRTYIMGIWVLFHNGHDIRSDIIVQKMEMVMEREKREGPVEGMR